jgi:hypothetical protein
MTAARRIEPHRHLLLLVDGFDKIQGSLAVGGLAALGALAGAAGVFSAAGAGGLGLGLLTGIKD